MSAAVWTYDSIQSATLNMCEYHEHQYPHSSRNIDWDDEEILRAMELSKANKKMTAATMRVLMDPARSPHMCTVLRAMPKKLAVAVVDARVRYLQRDEDTIAMTPISSVCCQRKRYFIRVIVEGADHVFLPPTIGTLSIIDAVYARCSWWIYIQSSENMRPMEIYEHLKAYLPQASSSCYFMDAELPKCKRAAYVWAQSVRAHLERLKREECKPPAIVLFD